MRSRVLFCLISTVALVGFLSAPSAAAAKPIIVSTPNSTRAVAMDSVDFTPEPFSAKSTSFLYGPDKSTRITMFVLNLSLQPGETPAAVTADAEDAAHRHYNLAVEYVGQIDGQNWMSAVILRLDQDMGDAGDVLIQLTYQSVKSNRVRVGVGHVGGGPADDANAGPTPAPPYTLSGQVILGGAGLSGVAIGLTGASTATATTDSSGRFSFVVTSAGDYTINASKRFFTLTPATLLLTSVANSQTINLTAVRTTYAISGIVKDDQGAALAGVSLKLESAAGGPDPQTTTTIADGTFSFPAMPAGYDYSVTPTNTSLFAFTQQTISALEQNSLLTFNGTRMYSISGFVGDGDQHSVSGATVTLSGAANGITTTDSSGNYTFSNLLAGRSYSVSAAKQDCFVSPGSQGFNLLKDERADFSAIRFYILKGKVTDENGKGLFGIAVTLTGPQSATLRTSSDGAYLFTLTIPGDYVLTPSREQDFYRFTPATKNLNIIDHQTVDFSGAIVISSPTQVLEFDGSPKTVDYSFFWPQDTYVGQFFWEFWAMPGENCFARYLLSDGFGGAHALLFGFNYPRNQAGHYTLMGNIWTSSNQPFYFNSDDGPSPGEWGHYAVGWDGKSIITYYDGVPVGKQLFTGPRVSTGTYNGATMLLIGGSNHQNLIGRIAQVRGFEENNPRAASPESSFVPQTVFSNDGQLLSYFFKPAPRVADLSYGYQGVQHNGWPRGFLDFYYYGCPGCPPPEFVFDPTAPDFGNSANPGQTSTLLDGMVAAPDGGRIFDSFTRNNSTYILNGKGGLGSTEAGSDGKKVWQTNSSAAQTQPFGILSGRAVILADETSLAWVSSGNANLDIRVDRGPGFFGSGTNTGVAFRVVDKMNYFFAYTSEDPNNPSGAKKLSVGYYQAGVRTNIATGISISQNDWVTLRVFTTQTGTINIFAGSTLAFSTNNSLFASATGAGLFNNGPALSLVNRWDNFLVLNTP